MGILAWMLPRLQALQTFGDEVAIAFSGAEDVAVIEYAHLTGRPFRVFSLDTGRLNPETYRLFDKVEKRYGIHIEYMFPDTAETEELVRTKGMFSFYEDGHQECCRIRKVRPLRRALRGLSAWITGQRKDQSPGTRAAVPVVQVDPVFDGKDGPGTLVKFNPVSNVTSAETWAFLRTMDVPVNELHSQGYDSIGCEPCTRPVLPNQHEREGRWWWEDATAKECGLHSGNVMDSAVDGAKEEAGDLYTSSNVEEVSKDEMEKMATSGADVSTMAVIYAPWCQFCQGLEPAYEEIAAQLQGTGVRVAKFRGDTERDFVAERFQLQTFPRIVFFSPRQVPKSSSLTLPTAVTWRTSWLL